VSLPSYLSFSINKFLTLLRLIKRSAIVGRLFYHTACILLAKTHPLESEFSPNMRDMQQKHAYEICGIVAHVKDRYVNLSLSLSPMRFGLTCHYI
jgi:hypothetical protein